MAESGAGDDGVGGGPAPAPRVYNYCTRSDFSAINTINWSVRPDKWNRVAIGWDNPTNLYNMEILLFDELHGSKNRFLSFPHPHPPSKVMFLPSVQTNLPDLIAASSDNLRIWRLPDADVSSNEPQLLTRCPPPPLYLTSFDWNEMEVTRIVISSDRSCRIWDIENEAIMPPVLTHTCPINDVSWGGADTFVTGSVDGTIHLFDRRVDGFTHIIHSTSGPSIERIEWNKLEPRYIVATIMRSPNAVAFDVRYPNYPVFALRHDDAVNAIAWHPVHRSFVSTGSDDGHVHTWDVSRVTQRVGDMPAASAAAAVGGWFCSPGFMVKHLKWSKARPQWFAMGSLSRLQIGKI